MSSPAGPNPLAVGLSILKSRRVAPPNPGGTQSIDHATLAPVLDDLEAHGVPALGSHRSTLAAYRDDLQRIDPDQLSPSGALAYWINLYNAGALDLAAEASAAGESTVLRVAGGFQRPWTRVAGEDLSLDDVEHGKIRRFGDPRIHGGLVCGSASCPTLRYEPFTADGLDRQLEDQMRTFLSGGGVVQDDAAGTLFLSRIFLWYGADFTRPRRMPTILRARKRAIADALGRWMAPEVDTWRITTDPRITFQPYDWSLACSIR